MFQVHMTRSRYGLCNAHRASAENSIILCVVLSIPHRTTQQPKMVHSDLSTFIVTNMCSPLRHRDPSTIYQAVTDISPRTPGFNPREGHVGFLVHRLAMEQVSLRILQFFVSLFHQYSTLISIHLPATTYGSFPN